MGALRAGHLDQLIHVYPKVIRNIHLYCSAGVWVFSLFLLVLFAHFCSFLLFNQSMKCCFNVVCYAVRPTF